MKKSLSASISVVESPKTELEEYLPGMTLNSAPKG